MLTPTERILVETAALTDAILLPLRGRFEQERAQVRFERRKRFFAAGVELVGGGSGSERMAYTRQIETVEAAGLITVAREGGKRTGAKLTVLGDTIARKLVARPTVAEKWEFFELSCDLDRRAFGRGLPEHLYVGFENWPETPEGVADLTECIKGLESAALPWLAFGWFSCTMSYIGHGWCSVTPEGHAARAAGCPADAPEGIEFNQEAGDEYDILLKRAEEEMDSASPENPSELQIPIPASCGWGWTDPAWFEAPK